MNKHVRVLEDAGLVTRRKLGRTTFLALDRATMRELQAWLAQYHAYWGTGKETLENYERFLASDPPSAQENR
jgi:DNA-binding transcriptional ArsR family regulator